MTKKPLWLLDICHKTQSVTMDTLVSKYMM